MLLCKPTLAPDRHNILRHTRGRSTNITHAITQLPRPARRYRDVRRRSKQVGIVTSDFTDDTKCHIRIRPNLKEVMI